MGWERSALPGPISLLCDQNFRVAGNHTQRRVVHWAQIRNLSTEGERWRWRHVSGLYKDPMQYAFSGVSAGMNVTRWPTVSRHSSALRAVHVLATHALRVWHARSQCLATRASHAVIARGFFRVTEPLPAKIKLRGSGVPHRSIAGRHDNPSRVRTHRHCGKAIVRSPSQTQNGNRRPLFDPTGALFSSLGGVSSSKIGVDSSASTPIPSS